MAHERQFNGGAQALIRSSPDVHAGSLRRRHEVPPGQRRAGTRRPSLQGARHDLHARHPARLRRSRLCDMVRQRIRQQSGQWRTLPPQVDHGRPQDPAPAQLRRSHLARHRPPHRGARERPRPLRRERPRHRPFPRRGGRTGHPDQGQGRRARARGRATRKGPRRLAQGQGAQELPPVSPATLANLQSQFERGVGTR